MRGDQAAAFVLGQDQLVVHHQEAACGFGLLDGAHLALGQVRDQRSRVGRRGEDIHVGKSLAQFFVSAHAHQAAHQVDHQIRVFLFKRLERAEAAVGLVLGGLAHDAGVQNDDIRLLSGFGVGIAQMLERRPHALGIGHVHLAALGPNMIFHVRNYNPSPTPTPSSRT